MNITTVTGELQLDSQLVSIITPSFNSAAYIEETIHSVQAQSYGNIEHIVIDGGSSDGTVEILRKYPHVKWISEKDSGQANALNKGFAMASGEIFGWLNADDLYYPDTVANAVDFLSRESGAVMVYSDCDVIDGSGNKIDTIRSRAYSEPLHILWWNVIPQPTAFFRKSAYLSAGKIDESLHFCMDFEFWVRLGRQGRLMRMSGRPSAAFRFVEGTKTFSQNDKFYVELDAISKKYGYPLSGWGFRQVAKKFLSSAGIFTFYKQLRRNV